MGSPRTRAARLSLAFAIIAGSGSCSPQRPTEPPPPTGTAPAARTSAEEPLVRPAARPTIATAAAKATASIKCAGKAADEPFRPGAQGTSFTTQLNGRFVHGSLQVRVVSDESKPWPCAQSGVLRVVELEAEERGDRRHLTLSTLTRSEVFHEYRITLATGVSAPLQIRVEPQPSATPISEEKAITIAIAAARSVGEPVPGMRELKGGVWVVYVEYSNVTDTLMAMEIDATTGKVLKKELGGGF